MGGKVGLKWEALMWFLKRYNLSKKDFVPIFLQMGRVWANAEMEAKE